MNISHIISPTEPSAVSKPACKQTAIINTVVVVVIVPVVVIVLVVVAVLVGVLVAELKTLIFHWHYRNCRNAKYLCHKSLLKEGNALFNDALNTFYSRLYGVRHMVKDHSDSERENPLPSHGLLFSFNSKGSFICTIPLPLLHQSWSTGWNEK